MTIVPTQADRDLAAALTGEEIMAYGMADLSEPVQAFARHRLAALEEAAKVAEAAVRVRQSYAYGREVLNPEVEEIATAIRALSNKGGRDGE